MNDDSLPRMKRTVIKVGRMSSQPAANYVAGSEASRIQMVWPLTREAASLSGRYDVERRLQRDVAVLVRGGR